ncbi:hypothetical protein GCM10020254_25400 [Streptomyces goshikiensis]
MRRTLAVLADAGRPLSLPALEPLVDLRRTRLETMLKVLDVDGAVHRVKGGWTATGEPWVYDAERYAWVARQRAAEQQAMRDYAASTGCRMEFPAPPARRRGGGALRPLRQLRRRPVHRGRLGHRAGHRARRTRPPRRGAGAAQDVADGTRRRRRGPQGADPGG